MRRVPREVAIINTLGAVGYMLLFAAWAFFAAVLLALAFDASVNTSPAEIIPSSGENVPDGANTTAMIASYIITGIIVLLSVGILLALPYLIGKWGSRLLRAIMKFCRIDITRRQLFFVKSLFAALPLVGLLIVNTVLMPESVTFAALYGVTVGLSSVSIGLFLAQLWIARRFNVPVDSIW